MSWLQIIAISMARLARFTTHHYIYNPFEDSSRVLSLKEAHVKLFQSVHLLVVGAAEPQISLQLFQEGTKAFTGQLRDIYPPPVSPVPCPVTSSLLDMLRTPPWGGLLIRWLMPHQLAPLNLEEQQLCFSPSWMAELLTLSLMESPVTLERKFISAGIHSLDLSVTPHSLGR